MNKQSTETMNRIQASLDYWVETLEMFPPAYDINAYYHEKYEENDTLVMPWTFASTQVDWEYRGQARIDFYLLRANSLDDDYIDAGVVHELGHVLVAPMTEGRKKGELYTKLEEFAVESLARALLAGERNGRRERTVHPPR